MQEVCYIPISMLGLPTVYRKNPALKNLALANCHIEVHLTRDALFDGGPENVTTNLVSVVIQHQMPNVRSILPADFAYPEEYECPFYLRVQQVLLTAASWQGLLQSSDGYEFTCEQTNDYTKLNYRNTGVKVQHIFNHLVLTWLCLALREHQGFISCSTFLKAKGIHVGTGEFYNIFVGYAENEKMVCGVINLINTMTQQIAEHQDISYFEKESRLRLATSSPDIQHQLIAKLTQSNLYATSAQQAEPLHFVLMSVYEALKRATTAIPSIPALGLKQDEKFYCAMLFARGYHKIFSKPTGYAAQRDNRYYGARCRRVHDKVVVKSFTLQFAQTLMFDLHLSKNPTFFPLSLIMLCQTKQPQDLQTLQPRLFPEAVLAQSQVSLRICGNRAEQWAGAMIALCQFLQKLFALICAKQVSIVEPTSPFSVHVPALCQSLLRYVLTLITQQLDSSTPLSEIYPALESVVTTVTKMNPVLLDDVRVLTDIKAQWRILQGRCRTPPPAEQGLMPGSPGSVSVPSRSPASRHALRAHQRDAVSLHGSPARGPSSALPKSWFPLRERSSSTVSVASSVRSMVVTDDPIESAFACLKNYAEKKAKASDQSNMLIIQLLRNFFAMVFLQPNVPFTVILEPWQNKQISIDQGLVACNVIATVIISKKKLTFLNWYNGIIQLPPTLQNTVRISEFDLQATYIQPTDNELRQTQCKNCNEHGIVIMPGAGAIQYCTCNRGIMAQLAEAQKSTPTTPQHAYAEADDDDADYAVPSVPPNRHSDGSHRLTAGSPQGHDNVHMLSEAELARMRALGLTLTPEQAEKVTRENDAVMRKAQADAEEKQRREQAEQERMRLARLQEIYQAQRALENARQRDQQSPPPQGSDATQPNSTTYG